MAFRYGHVALLGRPNVGKSTLLNRIVGQKVSIVSQRPQTTRKRVLGIADGEGYQVVFIDTPGIHEPNNRLGRAMVEAARRALDGVDLVLFVADGSTMPGDNDRQIAQWIAASQLPVLVCLNKMDRLKPENVQRHVDAYHALLGTEDSMFTTATSGHNVDRLMQMIVERMPEGEPRFSSEEYTDQSARFTAAELVREKILLATRQELPYSTAVMVESWEEEPSGLIRISASIIVEKEGQKAIVIGQGGKFIKAVGTAARKEIEELLGHHVFLELHVKVRPDWRMNPRMLQELEYTD
ncbi:MAG: GTPase Era [Fimbriimonadaceae bacterium]|nr:GTPase Era [Chthonomonadaceae bacterium]MCO5295274.1 GTPase Era [Fimbriimonadaceae bacterium]